MAGFLKLGKYSSGRLKDLQYPSDFDDYDILNIWLHESEIAGDGRIRGSIGGQRLLLQLKNYGWSLKHLVT